MSLGPENKRFRPASAPFSELKRENTYTQEERILKSNTATPVKSSNVPNPKAIIVSVVGIVIVGAIVAVVVVLVKQNQGDNVSKPHNGTNDEIASTGVSTKTKSTFTILSTSTVRTTKPSSEQLSSTSSQPAAISSSVITPETGIWSEWGQWTSCAVTCGTGVQTRYRECLKNSDQYPDCLGAYVEQGLCFASICPGFGKWGPWSIWSTCDHTCGNGTQLRNRSCLKTSTEDLNCVGKETQSQACNTYMCPDCNQICQDGVLNTACDRCECSNNIIGHVVDSDSFPLADVSIAEATTPYNIVIQTNSSGFFFLNTTCIGTNILLRKENYQDTVVDASAPEMQITMDHIVPPFIISEPYSKYRLAGENATLCCTAGGRPNVFYYEWFKDDVLLDSSLYPNGESLILSNLTFFESGQYKCRANSPVGSIQSESATLSVRDSSSEFCADAYQQKMQTLPDDCVQPVTNTAQFEVGECISKSCRLNELSSHETCQEGVRSCCGVSGYRTVTIDCTGYQITLAVVTGCSCQECGPDYLNIQGTAVGIDSALPLKYGDIWVNGELKTSTNRQGEFSFSVSSDIRKLSITAKDIYYNQFLDITKVFNIPDDLIGTFQITLRLFQKSEPITISSSVENRIHLGNSSSSSKAPVAEIVVPPNSFIYADGSPYNGTVSASLTYLDPTNLTVLRNIPGVFEFTDDEGNTQDLDTLGVFGLFFQDETGNPLLIDGNIDVYLTDDVLASDPDAVSNYKIWGLSETTGKWLLISTDSVSKRRRRRQTGLWVGQVNIRSYTWYNIDKFRTPSSSYCYFKTRIYGSYNLSPTSEKLVIQDYINIYFPIFRNTSMVDLSASTNTPSRTCYQAICDANPGFIEVSYWNRNTYASESLIPANPVIHGNNVGINLTERNLIRFNVTENGRILSLIFKITDNGPFFKDSAICENSSYSSNHFRFYYPNEDPDIYTFLYTFNPSSSKQLKPAERENISARVWYPEKPQNVSKVCYMKVSLTYMGWYGTNEAVKLRLLSYGGNNSIIKDFLFGIREVNISTNSSVCIEYKCSGDLHYFVGGKDTTKIKIFPIISSNMKCNVSLDNLAAELPENRNNVGSSTYVNYVPGYAKTSIGLFEATTDSGKLQDRKLTAYQDCINGGSHAVSFTCGFEYSGWWW